MGVSREVLYAEVWAEPMLQVAKRYAVSSSYMARVCTILNVPRPPVGYWAKQQVGKAPRQPPLPAALPGDQTEWTPGAALFKPVGVVRTKVRQLAPSEAPPQLSSKHGLARGVAEILRTARDSEGFLKPSKRAMVDVVTTAKSIGRIIKAAELLFASLEEKRCRVLYATNSELQRSEPDERIGGKGKRPEWPRLWSPSRPTVTYVGTVPIGLTLMESTREVEVAYVDGKYIPVADKPQKRSYMWDRAWTTKKDLPTGRFRLRAYSPYQDTTWQQIWDEDNPGDFEGLIPTIVAGLQRAAAVILEQKAAADERARLRHLEWEEQRKRWDREEKERKRLERQKRSRDQLGAIFGEWERQHRLDGFFDAVSQHARTLDVPIALKIETKIEAARKILGQQNCVTDFIDWEPPES